MASERNSQSLILYRKGGDNTVSNSAIHGPALGPYPPFMAMGDFQV